MHSWKQRMKMMMTSTCCHTLDCIIQEQNSNNFLWAAGWQSHTKAFRLTWIICMVYPTGREMDPTAPPAFLKNNVIQHGSTRLKWLEQHCFSWDYLSTDNVQHHCVSSLASRLFNRTPKSALYPCYVRFSRVETHWGWGHFPHCPADVPEVQFCWERRPNQLTNLIGWTSESAECFKDVHTKISIFQMNRFHFLFQE